MVEAIRSIGGLRPSCQCSRSLICMKLLGCSGSVETKEQRRCYDPETFWIGAASDEIGVHGLP